MKILKISFLFVLTASLCSFAYYKNVEEGKKESFEKFLNKFERTQLPCKLIFKAPEYKDDVVHKLKKNGTVSHEKKRYLGDEFEAFIPAITSGRRSRLGPSTYEAEVLVSTNNKFSTILYSRSRSFSGESKTYILATYDKHGKELAKNFIGHSNGVSYMTLEVNKELEIIAKAFVSEDEYNATEKTFFEKHTKEISISNRGEILVSEEAPKAEKTLKDVLIKEQKAQELG